jgi:hypothetical protein
MTVPNYTLSLCGRSHAKKTDRAGLGMAPNALHVVDRCLFSPSLHVYSVLLHLGILQTCRNITRVHRRTMSVRHFFAENASGGGKPSPAIPLHRVCAIPSSLPIAV